MAVGAAGLAASARAPLLAPDGQAPLPVAPTCRGSEDERAPARAQRRALRCLINTTRRRAELRPLRLSPILSASAALKAQDVRRCDELEHTACGKEPRAAAGAAGYPAERGWGEILYEATDHNRAAAAALERWLGSPEHRRTMLDPAWTEFGAGLLRDREGELDRAIWVVHFGQGP